MSEPKRPLILVVDDDPDTLALMERFLAREGYQVITVDSGEKALNLIRHLKPSLVLLDVLMPGLDGYQVCARLQQKEATAFVPVVFVTGLKEEQDKQRALSLGAADYLVKPVSREALLETVSRHLETGSRWYHVQLATDLWNERPLPEKFLEFQQYLANRLGLGAEAMQSLAYLKSSEVYALVQQLGLTEKQLAQHMAQFFGMPYVETVEPSSIQLGVLPTAFCRSNQVIAVRDGQGQNAFIISNPFVWGLEQLDLLNRAFLGEHYHLVLTEQKTISNLFFNEVTEAQEAHLQEEELDHVQAQELPIEKLPVAESASPIQVVKTLLNDAVRKGASDVHIEPEKDRIRVRYRIDGRMQPVVPLRSGLLAGITGRIKIMAGMDPAETRKPQDGGCAIRVDGREVELRVSTLAGSHGEVTVCRILGDNAERHRLEALGMEPAMLRQLRYLLAARQGMLLITGPTGSGKTTTLYAALNHLNTDSVNIVTVEDPIEADIAGVNQVQVHEKAGRSFAGTLRAMLRQDPDILMVGEIRDLETAEVASRAALTGHLVLSTVHTQHTLGTLARLTDMGIPSYLVASALHGVLAQRLVRKNCEACAEPYPLPPGLAHALEAQYGSLEGASFRRGKGCPRCHRTGTKGRIGVFELLTIDDDFRHLIGEGATPSVLREYLRGKGFHTLEDDAFAKAARGLIPPEEIIHLGFGLAQVVAAGDEAGE